MKLASSVDVVVKEKMHFYSRVIGYPRPLLTDGLFDGLFNSGVELDNYLIRSSRNAAWED
jgi:hypothetical protein